jgi:hypothetical protein
VGNKQKRLCVLVCGGLQVSFGRESFMFVFFRRESPLRDPARIAVDKK